MHDSNCMVCDWVGRWVGMTNTASARWNLSPRTLALSTVAWHWTTGGCDDGWAHNGVTVSQFGVWLNG